MRDPIENRHIKVGGRPTCISLELPFWRNLHRIAFERAIHINDLITEAAASRAGATLSGALRLLVLADLESRTLTPGTFAAGPHPPQAADRAAAASTPAPPRRILAGAAE